LAFVRKKKFLKRVVKTDNEDSIFKILY
jgi:hypothetical protein